MTPTRFAGPAPAPPMLSTAAVPAAEFRFAGPLDASTPDPHAISNTLVFAVLCHVCDPLVRGGPDLSLQPALATEWRQVDPATWEFKLRQGVTCANGSDFKADEVVCSFERAKQGGMASDLAGVTSIEKVDDHTMRSRTPGVNPVLPKPIPNRFVMDREWAEASNAVEPGKADNPTEGYADRNTMGTGPHVISGRPAQGLSSARHGAGHADPWRGRGQPLQGPADARGDAAGHRHRRRPEPDHARLFTPVGLTVAKEVEGSTAAINTPGTPDLDRTRALMKEAGRERGFKVALDCSSDRFMNDEATCIAIGSFLSRIFIEVTPRAQPAARRAKQITPPGL